MRYVRMQLEPRDAKNANERERAKGDILWDAESSNMVCEERTRAMRDAGRDKKMQ